MLTEDQGLAVPVYMESWRELLSVCPLPTLPADIGNKYMAYDQQTQRHTNNDECHNHDAHGLEHTGPGDGGGS